MQTFFAICVIIFGIAAIVSIIWYNFILMPKKEAERNERIIGEVMTQICRARFLKAKSNSDMDEYDLQSFDGGLNWRFIQKTKSGFVILDVANDLMADLKIQATITYEVNGLEVEKDPIAESLYYLRRYKRQKDYAAPVGEHCFYSFDKGETWYAAREDKGGVEILGPSEEIYPGILAGASKEVEEPPKEPRKELPSPEITPFPEITSLIDTYGRYLDAMKGLLDNLRSEDPLILTLQIFIAEVNGRRSFDDVLKAF